MRYAALLLFPMTLSACESWPEVELTEPVGEYTSEAGGSVDVTVALSRRPPHAIDVWAVSSTPREGVVAGRVHFEPASWEEPQHFTISGVDDAKCDGDRAYGVSIYARWHDDPSGGWLVDELHLINRDDDCAAPDASGEGHDD